MRMRTGMLTTIVVVLGALVTSAAGAQSPDPAAPDVRVTDIRSTFVPVVTLEGGGCEGPFLDLRLTVMNIGAGPYPSAADREAMQAMAVPVEQWTGVAVRADLDHAGVPLGQHSVPIPFTALPPDGLPPGGALETSLRWRVPDATPAVRIVGSTQNAHFMRVGNEGAAYESTADLPTWDLYPLEARTVQSRTEDGQLQAITQVTVQNRGATDTPGPVEVNVSIASDTSSFLAGWTGRTTGPIAAGGSAQVLGADPIDRALDPGFRVHVGTLALCPDGSYGDLGDLAPADDGRDLIQAGAAPPSAAP